ncbi:rhomboid family intramembrane serine protease [Nocardioides agariphilus]|jgi:membrane associated rhomboid family serine protease|uniref:Rhomboid family intramembrane serine protease n=1 Tax=Nocardioides agariphilus TaxID=433664 RepID=A0A930VRC8_9ACTN|nr:rhomboid family intramembrane serine protease [Nocardioides agariphilus]MBF4768535.1 rhomboid family intramembrane serine protease [Nocardioides agariphilus]
MSEPAPGTPTGEVPTCYRHPGREAYIRCQRCGRVICPDCMRDSPVGFQCPECVKEGARTTRSGRTAYGGLRPTNAAITSMVIIGLNAAVWLAIMATGGRGSSLVERLSLIPLGRCVSERASGAYYPSVHTELVCSTSTRGDGTWMPGVADGAYWQLLTSAFTHVEFWHIGFNMLALWVLGPQLEVAIGRARFIALYLISALAGSTLVYWASNEYGSTLGASGAVFGLMGALLVIAFKVKADYSQILMWIGINAVLTFTFSGISWQGHVGGFLGGVVVAAILAYAPRQRRTQVQLVGLTVVTVLLLVAIVARTASLTA